MARRVQSRCMSQGCHSSGRIGQHVGLTDCRIEVELSVKARDVSGPGVGLRQCSVLGDATAHGGALNGCVARNVTTIVALIVEAGVSRHHCVCLLSQSKPACSSKVVRELSTGGPTIGSRILHQDVHPQ